MPLHAGTLVNGDFDTTAIFHSEGRHAGLIDFGEVRGADPLFNLGHFLLHDGELLSWTLFDELLNGYQEVSDTAGDFEPEVRSSAVVLELRQLRSVSLRSHAACLLCTPTGRPRRHATTPYMKKHNDTPTNSTSIIGQVDCPASLCRCLPKTGLGSPPGQTVSAPTTA
jgi:hypothetical protein